MEIAKPKTCLKWKDSGDVPANGKHRMPVSEKCAGRSGTGGGISFQWGFSPVRGAGQWERRSDSSPGHVTSLPAAAGPGMDCFRPTA